MGVDVHLGGDKAGDDALPLFVDGSGRFIAGGFDSQDLLQI
jgi:hypothetical protein